MTLSTILAGTFVLTTAVQSCHAEKPLYYNILPTAVGNEEQTAADAKDYVRRTGVFRTVDEIVRSLFDQCVSTSVCMRTVAEVSSLTNDLEHVEVIGLADEVFHDEIDARWCHIRLVDGGASLVVSFPVSGRTASPVRRFSGARIRVHGVFARQIGGSRLLSGHRIVLRSPSDIEVLVPPPADDLGLPPLEVREPDDPARILSQGRRSAQGRVLAVWGGRNLLVASDAAMLGVQLDEGVPCPDAGAVVKVAGRTETDLFQVRLEAARLRVLKDPEGPLPAGRDMSVDSLYRSFTGGEGFNSHAFFKPVRIQGCARAVRSDIGVEGVTIQSGGRFLKVDASACPEAVRDIAAGSELAVTGVVIPETETWGPSRPFPRVHGIRLVVREASDVVILSSPPWWTMGRLLLVIFMLFAALVGFFAWNRILNRKAEQRGRALFRSEIRQARATLKIEERTSLAIELHDSLSQNLTGLAFQLASAHSALAVDPAAASRHLETAELMLLSSRTELKRCLWDLREEALEIDDMNDAVRRTLGPVLGKACLDVRFNVPRSRLSDSTTHTILCIVRELSSNGVRHGGAKTVRVAGELHDGVLSFSVRDDGCGFDTAACPGPGEGHFGLDGVRERVARMGGRFFVESVAGVGTRAVVTVNVCH